MTTLSQPQPTEPEPPREESADKTKPVRPEPRLKKFFDQQVDKVADRIWTLIFSGLAIVGAGAAHYVPRVTSMLLNPRVALWLFPALVIPATYGAVVFIRWLIYRHTPEIYVTVDPERCFCQETMYGQTPALHVYMEVAFTNTGLHDQLLMYAYPRGTKSISHFYEPIALPPKTATLDVDIQFYCTLPLGRLKDPYTETFIFVDAGGHKYRQRISLKLQPKAVPTPPKPAAPQQQANVTPPQGS